MSENDVVTKLYEGTVRSIPDGDLREQALLRFSEGERVVITERRRGLKSEINIRRVIKRQFIHICPYCFKEQPSAPTEERYLCVNCGKLVIKNLKDSYRE